jgi:hypothetical protein
MAPNRKVSLQNEIEHTREKTMFSSRCSRSSFAPSQQRYNLDERGNSIRDQLLSICDSIHAKKRFWITAHHVLPLPETGSLFPNWDKKSVRFQHAHRIALLTFATEYQNNCNQVLKVLDGLVNGDYK